MKLVTLSANGKSDKLEITEFITSSVYSPVSLVYPIFLSTLSSSSVGTSVNKTYSSSVVPKCLVLLLVCMNSKSACKSSFILSPFFSVRILNTCSNSFGSCVTVQLYPNFLKIYSHCLANE